MDIIYHITTQKQWEQAKLSGVYRGDTLDSDGFIHCSTTQQVIKIANTIFGDQKKLVLLSIDLNKVQADIRWEGTETKEKFPHIYGNLNMDAVTQVKELKAGINSKFSLP